MTIFEATLVGILATVVAGIGLTQYEQEEVIDGTARLRDRANLRTVEQFTQVSKTGYADAVQPDFSSPEAFVESMINAPLGVMMDPEDEEKRQVLVDLVRAKWGYIMTLR